MNNLFGIGILLELRDKVSNRLRGVSQALDDVETQAERTAQSVNDLESELNSVGSSVGGINSNLGNLGSEFSNTSQYTRRFERDMQRLSYMLGGDVPESTREAYGQMYNLRQEIRRTQRAFGSYSPEVMKARDNLNQYLLSMDDTAFKQIYMRGQLGLTEMQLKQQANSMKLNARMTKLMSNTTEDVDRNLRVFSQNGIRMSESGVKGLSYQTSILVRRMEGLQKAGVKPEMLIPPSTPGAFEILNTAVGSSTSKLYGLSAVQRSFGAGLEKVIKKFSAVKVAVAQANGSMAKYQLLMRQATTGMMNLGLVAPIMAMGVGMLYGGLVKLAFSTNEGLQELYETIKGKVLKAMEPLLNMVDKVAESVLKMVGKVADWITKFNEAHPVIAQVASAIMLLLPALTLIALPIGFLPFGIQSIMVALNGLWTLIGPFVASLMTASGIALGFASAIAVLGVGLTHLWKTNEGFRNAVTNAWESIKQTGVNVFNSLKESIQGFIDAFKEGGLVGVIDHFDATFKQLVDNIYNNLPDLVNSGVEMITKFVEGISTTLPKVMEKGSEILGKLVEGVTKNIGPFVESAITILETWINSWTTNIGHFLNLGVSVITTLANGLIQALPTLIDCGVEILNSIIQTITDNIGIVIDGAIQLIEGLVKGISEAVPLLVDGVILILEMFVQFLTENLPVIVDSALYIIEALVEGLVNNLPVLIDSALNLVLAIVEGIVNNLPLIADSAITIISTLLTGILNSLPQIIMMGVQIITSLVAGLIQSLGQIIGSAIRIVASIVSTILQNLPQFLVMGIQIVANIVSGIIQTIVNVISAIGSLTSQALSALSDSVSDFVSIGGDIIKGLAQGITNGISSVVNAISGVVGKAIQKGKELLGIKSPSRVFRQIGAWTSEGMAIGINQDAPKVDDAITTVTQSVINTAHNLNTRVSTLIEPLMPTMTDFDLGVLQLRVEIENEDELQDMLRPYSLEVEPVDTQESLQRIVNTTQVSTNTEAKSNVPQVTEVKNEYNFNITVEGSTGDAQKDKDIATRIYNEIKRLQELDNSFKWNANPVSVF